MSTARQSLLEHARTACQQCFTRQLELIADANRLSSEIRIRNASLYLEVRRMANLDPWPDVATETVTDITSNSAVIAEAQTQDDLEVLQENLLTAFRSIGEYDESTATVATQNQLNKRMVDLMHLLKDKIRGTRRRLNDSGGGYDQNAYKSVRNQIYLSQHTYIEQLDNDLVFATNEDCAKVEQIYYPAIQEATAYNFVQTLQDMLDFLTGHILTATAA